MLEFFHLFLEKIASNAVEEYGFGRCESVVWKCCYSSLAECAVWVWATLTIFFQVCHLGGVNYNTKFIDTQDFDLTEWHISVLKSQHKHNISIVIHGWVTTEMWFHYCSPYSHQYGTACPLLPGRICALKPAQVYCFFQSSLCWLLGVFFTF